MPRKQKEGRKRRTLVVKTDTYQRLEKFVVELIRKKSKPRITFDEAINELLDTYYSSTGNTAHADVKKI